MSVAESTRKHGRCFFSKTWQVFFWKSWISQPQQFPAADFWEFFHQQSISLAQLSFGLDPLDCGCPTPDVLTWNQQPLLFVASSGNLRWNQILRHVWTCHFYKVIKLCFNSDELDQIKWSQLNVIPKLNHVWTWFIGYLLLSRTNPGIKTFSWTISWKRHPYTRYIPW